MLTGVIFKYASAGLLALCLILATLWQMDKAGAKKWKARAEHYQAELKRISTAKDEQRDTTKRNVDSAEREIIRVETVIRPLESKPIGENLECRTPDLEQWRGVL